MKPVPVDAVVVVELVECLEFCCEWIDHDHHQLDDSLQRFTNNGYTIAGLRDDLTRFAANLRGALEEPRS